MTSISLLPGTLTSETTQTATTDSPLVTTLTVVTGLSLLPSTLTSETSLSLLPSLDTSAGGSSTGPTPVNSTSIDQPATSSGFATQTPSSTHTSASTQLSTESIVGIAIGSIAAAILLVLGLLFALGFRVQRAAWRRHIKRPEIPEARNEHPVAALAADDPHGKAELPDADYTRRLERLHDGAKPELEGSRPRKLVWRVFSIRSVRKRGPRQVAAELETEPTASGPHELPGDDIVQPNSEETLDARETT